MKKENEPVDFSDITNTSKQSGFLGICIHADAQQEMVAHSYRASSNLIWATYHFGW